MKTLRDRRFEDPEVQRAFDEIVSVWNAAVSIGLFFNGVQRTGLALTTADTEIFHGLNRIPTIVMPTLLSANATVFVLNQHASPRTHILVRASAAVTCNLVIA